MLLAPLALSASGGTQEKGDEVVLSAGLPPGGGAADAGGVAGLDVGIQASVDAGIDVGVDAEVTAQAEGSATTVDEPAAAPTTTTSAAPVAKAAVQAQPAAAVRAKVAAPATTTIPKPATTTTTTKAKVTTMTTAKPVPAAAPPTTSSQDAVWDRLAQCESGNTNDPNPPYYGYWQISAGTWLSLGEIGLPNQASRVRQLAASKRLQSARGWGEWPECARQLGLQ